MKGVTENGLFLQDKSRHLGINPLRQVGCDKGCRGEDGTGAECWLMDFEENFENGGRGCGSEVGGDEVDAGTVEEVGVVCNEAFRLGHEEDEVGGGGFRREFLES